MRRTVTILALIIFAMNASLWVNGEFDDNEFVGVYKGLPPGLQDLNSLDADQLTMLDANGTTITTSTGAFLATQFDFTTPEAIVGSLFTLADFVINLMINLTFGITLLVSKLNAPTSIVVFIGSINFMIAAVGLIEMVAFINSVIRGGGAN